MKRVCCLLLLLVGAFAMSQRANATQFDRLEAHPRLLIDPSVVEKIERFVEQSPNAKSVHDYLLARSEEFISKPTLERKVVGRRLLAVSREAVRRIFYLSYSWMMTHDERFAARCEQEMLAVCSFEDWNPSHFLDVGEMTVAVAIGYDWLYDYLSPASRELIEQAIYEKGLRASENEKHAVFFKRHSNWNQVCNAGLIFGALATMERYHPYNSALIYKALESNVLPQRVYGPDGGYPEGYSYWEYGTSFEVLLIEALRTAATYESALERYPGFLRSAHFINYMSAPSGRCYNFYDSGAKVGFMPAKYWFARELNDRSVVAIDEQLIASQPIPNDRLLPLYLIFGSQLNLHKQPDYPKSRTWVNHGISPVFAYRSGWESPNDSYFAIKGGSPSDHHAHMDGGSFIYEYDGVRWAVDLGMHDYHYLESRGVQLWSRAQKSQRWTVYRIGLDSHNTLSINGKRHRVDGYAAITSHFDKPNCKGAELDLTPLFGDKMVSVVRRAELDSKDRLTITDRLTNGAEQNEVLWKMITTAKAELIDSRTIALYEGGKTLYLQLARNCKAEPVILPAHEFRPYEIPEKGITEVGFRLTVAPDEQATIEVHFTPKCKR